MGVIVGSNQTPDSRYLRLIPRYAPLPSVLSTFCGYRGLCITCKASESVRASNNYEPRKYHRAL